MSKTYRHQGNRDLHDAMQELRRSSAASKHKNKSKYTRKTKHKENYGE